MDPASKLPKLSLGLPIEPLFDAVPPEKRRLGLFLLFALSLHLMAFYFIRVVYPQPGFHSTPRIHVTLASVDGMLSNNRANLQFWYSIEDPSLLIRPQGALVDSAKIEITPIRRVETDSTQAATPPPLREQAIAFLPDGLPPLTDRASAMLETPREVFAYASVSATTTAKPQTTLYLDPTLTARLRGTVPFLPSQSAGLLTDSGVTVLRVGVNGEGRVAHVLIDQSSGKSAVDALAVQALRQTRFEPDAKQALLWGQVTVYWQFEPDQPAPAAPTKPAATP